MGLESGGEHLAYSRFFGDQDRHFRDHRFKRHQAERFRNARHYKNIGRFVNSRQFFPTQKTAKNKSVRKTAARDRADHLPFHIAAAGYYKVSFWFVRENFFGHRYKIIRTFLQSDPADEKNDSVAIAFQLMKIVINCGGIVVEFNAVMNYFHLI